MADLIAKASLGRSKSSQGIGNRRKGLSFLFSLLGCGADSIQDFGYFSSWADSPISPLPHRSKMKVI